MLFCTFTTCTAYASTTEDLYDMYEYPYHSSCSTEVIDTIERANQAQISAFQYNNVIALQPLQDTLLVKYKDEVDKYAKYLHNGYNLSYTEILELEEQYKHALSLYLNYKQHYDNRTSISINMPVVPTKTELGEAYQTYNKYVDSTYIGDLEHVPNIITVVDDYQHKSDQTVFYVHDAAVYCPFNGIVSSIEDDTLTLTLPDYIVIRFKGITDFKVQEGTKIKQGDVIGIVNSKLSVGLNIDNHKLNLRKLQPEINKVRNTVYKNEVEE